MNTTDIKSIAIAGMGLMGGSMAKAIKAYTEFNVLGIDCDVRTLNTAVAAGAADRAGGAELLCDADAVVLAMSPEICVEFMKQHAGLLRRGTVITDLCGVKRVVTDALEPLCIARGLRFIGGHPMAGREHSGFVSSDSELFVGCSYILTPTARSDNDALDFVSGLARAVGSTHITVTTPENHDRIIAFTSQLPHVLAGAYVKSPACAEHKGYSAGSYRDVSRVAPVDEALWSELFLHNGDFLCCEIDTLIMNLRACRDAVASGDTETLSGVLREGRLRKQTIDGEA